MPVSAENERARKLTVVSPIVLHQKGNGKRFRACKAGFFLRAGRLKFILTCYTLQIRGLAPSQLRGFGFFGRRVDLLGSLVEVLGVGLRPVLFGPDLGLKTQIYEYRKVI